MLGKARKPKPPKKARSSRAPKRWKRIFSFIRLEAGAFVCALVITIIMIVGKECAAHQSIIVAIDHWLYGKLHPILLGGKQLNPRIAVIDISELDLVERKPNYIAEPVQAERKPTRITPRAPLLALLKAVNQVGVRAIAVDVDLSPYKPDHDLQAEDIELLDWCNSVDIASKEDVPDIAVSEISGRKKNTIRIAVGSRSIFGSKDKWLGRSQYSHLAAISYLPAYSPKELHSCNPWMLPLQHSDLYRPANPQEDSSILGLAASLAPPEVLEKFQHLSEAHLLCDGLRRLSLADVGSHVAPPSHWTIDCYHGDYSYIGSIPVIKAHTPEEIFVLEDKLKEKFIFIGTVRLTHARDLFTRPGISAIDVEDINMESIPGVLCHACGLATILDGPIFLFTEAAELKFDIIASLSILAFVFALRCLYFVIYGKDVASRKRTHILATCLMVLLVFGITFYLGRYNRIIWIDSVLVIFALGVHSTVEHFAKTLLERIHGWLTPKLTPKPQSANPHI